MIFVKKQTEILNLSRKLFVKICYLFNIIEK